MFPLILILLAGGTLPAAADERPRITIIIDDLGYALRAGQRAVDLPGPVVYAVLPQTPRARALAEYAHARGKEVLLHLPLQSMDETLAAEPGGVTLDMSQGRFRLVFAENVASVPFAIGVNGHRGSLLTRHPGHMRWLMDELADRDLLFIDSYTTVHSVALDIALEMGIPARRRDVFLDADPGPAAIALEFERLKQLALARGSALGIGHPYPGTLEFLEQALPELAQQGFVLSGIRDYLAANPRSPTAPAGPATPGAPAAAAGEDR